MVKTAAEKLKGARHESHGARADRLPKIMANYAFTHLDDAPFMKANGMPPAARMAHQDQYHWDLTLVQPLFSGFALSARHEMARVAVRIKEKEKTQTVLDVTRAVKGAYYNVLLTGKLLSVADETIASLRSHETDNQRFYDRGVIRLNDLLRVKVALAAAVQNREKARAAARMSRADLNRWLALDIHRDTRVEDVGTVSPVDYSLADMLQAGLQNRPLLQVLRLTRETLANITRLEKSSYYPQVAFVGGYGEDGDAPLDGNNDYSNDHNAWVGVQARWTIFDSFGTKAKVARAQADESALLQTLRSAADGIRLEIKNACLELEVAEKNIDTARVARVQAEENLRITRLGYRQQAATSTELLDARTDLTRAQTHYYMALYGYLDAVAALERAVGGNLHGQGETSSSE